MNNESSIIKVTAYKLCDTGLLLKRGRILRFATISKLTLGCIQSPIWWVPRALLVLV